MVEFALVLPVLLVLIYGLLETGRLLFIYSSVVSASRNAARYGSADGTSSNGMPYYQDCNGISAAANNLAIINPLSNVSITYDAGWDSNSLPQYITGISATIQCKDITWTQTIFNNMHSGDRINVTVTAQYSPIIAIANLIPSFKPITITSQSSRTLLLSVAINVTPGTAFALTQTQIVKIASYTATYTPIPPTNTWTPIPPTNTATSVGTPTNTATPVPPSSTPPSTNTPTSTNTPEYLITPTIPCGTSQLSANLTLSGAVLTMAINNNTGNSLRIKTISVNWQANTVVLQTVSLSPAQAPTSSTINNTISGGGSTTFSVDTSNNVIMLASGPTTLTVNFGSTITWGEIQIYFWTNGCYQNPLDLKKP
jgi:Flp pilus assembly protein TadG